MSWRGLPPQWSTPHCQQRLLSSKLEHIQTGCLIWHDKRQVEISSRGGKLLKWICHWQNKLILKSSALSCWSHAPDGESHSPLVWQTPKQLLREPLLNWWSEVHSRVQDIFLSVTLKLIVSCSHRAIVITLAESLHRFTRKLIQSTCKTEMFIFTQWKEGMVKFNMKPTYTV